jgi:hypothetical protein
MRSRIAFGAVLLLLGTTACRPDTIDLGYHYDAGTEATYRLTVLAEAEWAIAGEGASGSYTAAFDVTESVESSDDDSAIVDVTMDPVRIEPDGLPPPGPETKTFSLRVGPNGEVLEVLEVDGVPATALPDDAIAFIGTYRPPLPLDPVSLRDRWRSQQQLQLETVFQDIVTLGRLDRLDSDGTGDFADVRYTGEGPLTATTILPQGDAELNGTTTLRADARLDIDGGFLREATSVTTGQFDVTIVPRGGRAPLEGTLDQELDVTVERIE